MTWQIYIKYSFFSVFPLLVLVIADCNDYDYELYRYANPSIGSELSIGRYSELRYQNLYGERKSWIGTSLGKTIQYFSKNKQEFEKRQKHH